jgi:hypothetical protein
VVQRFQYGTHNVLVKHSQENAQLLTRAREKSKIRRIWQASIRKVILEHFFLLTGALDRNIDSRTKREFALQHDTLCLGNYNMPEKSITFVGRKLVCFVALEDAVKVSSRDISYQSSVC